MPRFAFALAGSLVLALACSRPGPPPEPEGPDLGDVMAQVGRRFEVAGRAAAARRFELAAFEAGEIGEIFEDEVPHAHLPKEGPTQQIPALAKAFAESIPTELKAAADSRDPARFQAAYAHASQMCNACHLSAAKGFIEIPSVPGQSVPLLETVPVPSAAAPW